MTELIKTYVRLLKKQLKNRAAATGGRHGDRAEIPIAGRLLKIRSVRPEDAMALLDMHTRLSRESLYFRYLSLHKPGMDDVKEIAGLPGDQGAAFVAEFRNDRRIIAGLAYYRFDADGDRTHPELALVVEDRFQGCGVGKALLQALCRFAEASGCRGLLAVVHSENRRMRRLLQSMPYPIDDKIAGDTVEARIRFRSRRRPGWKTFAGIGSMTSPFSSLDLELDI